MVVVCKICGKEEVITERDVFYHFEKPSLKRFMQSKGIIWNDEFICLECLKNISSIQIEDGITVWIGKWGRYFYLAGEKGVWVETL